VLSVVKAMTQAFQSVDDAGFRRTWIVLKQADWWRDALPDGDSTIEISMPAGSVAAKLPAFSSRIAPSVLKVLGDRNYLDPRLSAAEVDVVHLPYQDGVFTELPFVYFPHDLQHRHFPENFTTPQIRHRETRWSRRALAATQVVVAGEHVRQDLIKFWQLNAELISVYPFPSPILPESVATSTVVPSDPYLIYPAVTWPHKNHETLINAISLLKSRNRMIRLILTGAHNSTHHSLMKLVRDLQLSDRVRHLGHVDESELAILIRRARAVVLPSLFEATSLTAFDAIRAGRPLLCSDREFFRSQCGDRASYFDPLDAYSIADAIEVELMKKGEHTYEEAADDLVARQLSLSTFASNLYATYRLCAAGQ
jgi:glycosyltransferase involved in cell wall biosynthesis